MVLSRMIYLLFSGLVLNGISMEGRGQTRTGKPPVRNVVLHFVKITHISIYNKEQTFLAMGY